MRKKKEFKVINPVKVEAEQLVVDDKTIGADDAFEKEYQRRMKRERISEIVSIALPFIILLLGLTFLTVEAVKESNMRKDCVTALAQTYHMTDYLYDVEKISDNLSTSNKDIEYLCKVTIYNDAWYIEAIMSVTKDNKIKLEKIIKIE